MNTQDLYKECVRLIGELGYNGAVDFRPSLEVAYSRIAAPVEYKGCRSDLYNTLYVRKTSGWEAVKDSSANLTLLTALWTRLWNMAGDANKVSKEQIGQHQVDLCNHTADRTHNFLSPKPGRGTHFAKRRY